MFQVLRPAASRSGVSRLAQSLLPVATAMAAVGKSMAERRTYASTAADPGVAVITGAGSGIGRALSLTLAARGFTVVGIGRREAALQQTRELASTQGNAVEIVVADVSEDAGRSAVVARVGELVGGGRRLVCLVHNAAVLGEVCPSTKVTSAGFRGTMATNVEAPLLLTQALAGTLADSGGRVLHVSSGAAHKPMSGWLSYCTSKAALYQLMQVLDLELKPQVRVSSVRPGVVDTEMQAELRASDFATVDRFRALKEDGGLDSPENVADFIAWMLLQLPADEFGGREWDINNAEDQKRWQGGRTGGASRL